jgi:hypothetical protein
MIVRHDRIEVEGIEQLPAPECAAPSSNCSVTANTAATESRFAVTLNRLLQQNRPKAVVRLRFAMVRS